MTASQSPSAAAAAALPRESANDTFALPQAIPADFLAEVLRPYRDNAKYLRSAEITHLRGQAGHEPEEGLVVGRGRFAIDESCYIDDTGHFNAVEFNICFNQLAYVVFGHIIASGLLQSLLPRRGQELSLSYADYKRHQLPSMLIAKLEGRFSKQLHSGDFWGQLTIDRISAAGRAYFCFTSIAFSDDEEVKARGSVVLAFSPEGADGQP